MNARKNVFIVFAVLGIAVAVVAQSPSPEENTSTLNLKLSDFYVHDPWILAHQESKTYYLYTSARRSDTGENRYGVMTYKSKDLEHWEGPHIAFLIPDGTWANPAHGAWAPEVHVYKGKYYLFVTLHNRDKTIDQPQKEWNIGVTHNGAAYPPHMRGTQIFVSDSPTGPFKPIPGSPDRPHTREDFMTLDGTLYIEDDVPWMVYCHEWIQLIDGTMEAVRLKPDLSAAVGDPIYLFKASNAPWFKTQKKVGKQPRIYVTDGPFLYKTKKGKLLMLWSSYRNGLYVQTIAHSVSGKLQGPWGQYDPIVGDDSGHGMIFKTFDNRLMLVLHQPFRGPTVRAKLFELEDTGNSIRVKNAQPSGPARPGKLAAKPLFRDPVHDGAADPSLCWNREEGKWFMFYTNRRANEPNTPGVSWVHGTRIGIAESSDGGASWEYRGTAEIDYGKDDYTYWAPEVLYHNGVYHMYLSIVPGIFTDWNASRHIIHLTSKDLLKWKYESTLKLSSDKVIDACVSRLPDGTWRLWYNNERDHKSIYYADSPDLFAWEDRGKAIGDRPGEGPKVFRWKDCNWMVVDVWKGLGIYKSDDCLKWTRQENNLLMQPGQSPTDRAKGQHADVVVNGDRAFLFYFTHQAGEDASPDDPYSSRRTVMQVVELKYKDGELTCDRDEPTHILLQPIDDKNETGVETR